MKKKKKEKKRWKKTKFSKVFLAPRKKGKERKKKKTLKKYSDKIEKEKLRKTDELGFALVCEEEKFVILFKLAH